MGPANRLYQIAKRSFIKSDQFTGARPPLIPARSQVGQGTDNTGFNFVHPLRSPPYTSQGILSDANSIIGFCTTETILSISASLVNTTSSSLRLCDASSHKFEDAEGLFIRRLDDESPIATRKHTFQMVVELE
jgi:hypothetical protein